MNGNDWLCIWAFCEKGLEAKGSNYGIKLHYH